MILTSGQTKLRDYVLELSGDRGIGPAACLTQLGEGTNLLEGWDITPHQLGELAALFGKLANGASLSDEEWAAVGGRTDVDPWAVWQVETDTDGRVTRLHNRHQVTNGQRLAAAAAAESAPLCQARADEAGGNPDWVCSLAPHGRVTAHRTAAGDTWGDEPAAPDPAPKPEPVLEVRHPHQLRPGDIARMSDGDQWQEVAAAEPRHIHGDVVILWRGGTHHNVARDWHYQLADAATAAQWRRERDDHQRRHEVAAELVALADQVRRGQIPVTEQGACLQVYGLDREQVAELGGLLGGAERRCGDYLSMEAREGRLVRVTASAHAPEVV